MTTDPTQYLSKFLQQTLLRDRTVPDVQLRALLTDPDLCHRAQTILDHQRDLMNAAQRRFRLRLIQDLPLPLPNATVGQDYTHTVALPTDSHDWKGVRLTGMTGQDELGLAYDPETQRLWGQPTAAGDHTVTLLYALDSDPDEDPVPRYKKAIRLTVNPNPRSLWQDKPSDPDAPFYKADVQSAFEALGDKQLLAGSKRGRSHANVGSFRDDHFGYRHYPDTGWTVVLVADGAGSATYSRKGSELACSAVLDHLETQLTPALQTELTELLAATRAESDEQGDTKLRHFYYRLLGNAALKAHQLIKQFAEDQGHALRDYHTTLALAAVLPTDAGYAIGTFSVGDCPIGLLPKGQERVQLLNALDVGEFGGGTRFLTMPSIFQDSAKLMQRIQHTHVRDFDYLVLMTDGIYDPKFEVEANLEKYAHWQAFLADLRGDNPAQHGVDLSPDNPDAAQQLLTWMDFWSPGNHDDRTLLLLF